MPQAGTGDVRGRLTPEQLCLLDRSHDVWDRRGFAKESGLAYNEEPATETLLLDLKRYWPGRISIRAFSKAEERKNGADWAWAFLSADGVWCQTMLVQAKRLDDVEQDYRSIDHQIGGSKTARRQIDVLIETAATLAMPPMYAFYNHLSDEMRVPQACSSLDVPDAHSWGVAVAPAEWVRSSLPDKSFDRHRAGSIALHCLLCSHGSGRKGAKGSPAAISEALARMGAIERTKEGPPLGFSSGLPPLFLRAETAPRLEAVLLAEEFPNLAGTVVFTDAREAEEQELQYHP